MARFNSFAARIYKHSPPSLARSPSPMTNLTLSFITVLALFSLSSPSILAWASGVNQSEDNVIRVRLESKLLIPQLSGSSPNGVSDTDIISPRTSSSGEGSAMAEFLSTHADHAVRKYLNKLSAYETNTSATANGTVPEDSIYYGGNVSLVYVNRTMWMGTIEIGTPPVNFTVDIDTGSADLVIPGISCNDTCNGHTRYDPTQSSTSVNIDETFDVNYGSAAGVSGTLYADNVSIGGKKAMNQTFGAATVYPSNLQYSSFKSDGVLGLAFPAASALEATTLLQNLLLSGAIKQGVFGLALSSQPGQGELTIGGTNTNLYQESTIEYVNVDLEDYWQVRLASVTGSVGASEVRLANQSSYAEAIVDSGTVLILTDNSIVSAFYANIPGAGPSSEIGGGVYTIPCEIADSISLTLNFSTRNYTIAPSFFSLGPVSEGSSNCIGGLGGADTPYWILGDVFLQTVYSIFDFNASRIGFADLV